MINLFEADFNTTYNALDDIIFPIHLVDDGLELDTTRYIEFLNKCLEKYGGRFAAKTTNYMKTHVHHIFPLSFGGPDIDSNKISLSIADHQKAHKILAEDNPESLKAQKAVQRLCFDNDGNQLSPADYIKVTKQIAKIISRKIAGEANPNYGKHMSDDQKQAAADYAKNHSTLARKIVVEYSDGTKEVLPSVMQAGEILFGDYYKNPGAQLRKMLRGEKRIPIDTIKAIYYEDSKYDTPEDAKEAKPVKGISLDGKTTLEANSTREAARQLINNSLIDVSGYSDPEASISNNIRICANSNKANTELDLDKNTYKNKFNYY